MKILHFLIPFLIIGCGIQNQESASAQQNHNILFTEISQIKPGAQRTDLYMDMISGKTVGLICNHTSFVGNRHLVDTLVKSGIDVKVIFSPEHGFRGQAENGAEISDEKDQLTGIKVISLYGNKKQPAPSDLAGLDVLIFDIQDVGVRFYTYISTLALVMEAAARENIPLIILDRPNPNGFYIDGPVLDTNFSSFVGMHPVPVVYGMTIGEYGLMVNGESWLNGLTCDLTVIPVSGYSHKMLVKLSIAPSPNLPDWESIYLYPSLCLFEGTIISVGRGTGKPFRVFGHPDYLAGSYAFTPERIPGVSENPPYMGKTCFGTDVTMYAANFRDNPNHFTLQYLLTTYQAMNFRDDYFNSYFNKLAGNATLMRDIKSGMTESEIRKSWEKDLSAFKIIRSKYLLYPE